MNILYLANHLDIGGISSYCLTLAGGMKKRGHNVYIASSSGQLVPRFISEGAVFIPIPIRTKSEISLSVYFSRLKLLKAIKENNIDIIHANTRVTQVLSFFLEKACGKPYVSTCHGFFKKRFFRRVFPCWGKKVIAISESVKEHLAGDFNVRQEDIRVVHSGIDIDKFQVTNSQSRNDMKRKFGLGDGPVVGIVARLSEEKGHIYLIEAMQEVIVKVPDAQLLIVGDGKMKARLWDLVQSLGLSNNTFFVSTVTDTSSVLAAMDLFVLPSSKEGLGLALMEAMASGIGVIGSQVGGIKSLIQDKHNGLSVSPGDAQQLSSAILELLVDPDKAGKLGQNARAFIQNNFSQEKMITETLKVYQECLNVNY